ncbi:MAG: hypothetical protein M8467_01510 [Anaerolineae bacterium]|nr:hypothetical protein [Anaerolineae bacterium]
MIKLLRKRREQEEEPAPIPVPAELPPLEGLVEDLEPEPRRMRRTWLWTLAAAIAVLLLMLYVAVLGGLAIYDGLKDRSVVNQQIAQEHYALGLQHFEAQDFELAVAEFDLALRYDASLRDARDYLQEAKDKVKAEATPTSETRREAAVALYRQAVTHYENGVLEQALAALENLRGLDPEYQAENVQTMLVTAHQRLGLDAAAEGEIAEATSHFETVLAMVPGDQHAQDQLNLIQLYTAALSYWDRDWTATIQALKGLRALAPDYADVEIRLHNAYVLSGDDLGEQGDWCRAADQYAAAVEVLPLERSVDRRDDARITCQATAEAPTPRPTSRATASAGVDSTPGVQSTPTAAAGLSFQSSGRIAFSSYDAMRRQHDIYVVDLPQRDAQLLRAEANQPAFRPGGGRLAYRSLHPQHLGLSILDLRGGDPLEITVHSEDSAPTWSPDGNQIVFASNKHGDRRWRLYSISPGAVRGEGEEWAYGQMPAWAPDGSRIAYQGCDERGGDCGIWVMQPGGTRPARLTTGASDTAPAWSPDSSQIAFISSRAGNWEIYLVDIATGREQRLTDHASVDAAPTWSPNGRQLAFLSNRQGGWAIYIIDIRSGATQKVIAAGNAYPNPLNERMSWIP